MRKWIFMAGLAIGSLTLLGCDQQAGHEPIQLVDDSPVLGVWFLQAAGDRPVAIGSTIRFEFKPHGQAVYERTTDGPEAPDRYELAYNLTGNILSITSDSELPGAPNIAGQIEVAEDGRTLRINTHADEDWLLTRAELPGGEVEAARRLTQADNQADPRLVRVQHLAYACSTFSQREGRVPGRILDLVQAGLVTPQQVTASGQASDVPARFERMTEQEKSDWLEANAGFVFFFRYADSGHASSVVVCTLPRHRGSDVVVGMANGAVFIKPAGEAAQLVELQVGSLPDRWPGGAADRGSATAGLEPLSD